MKNEEKKKGILGGLFTKKEKGGCCDIELEEVAEDMDEKIKENEGSKKDNNSCCG
ncbi:hypothetical protein [Clostridiisalibacter paucivorans]|jgi:hypothetical protein|uniref:hypothetical protein n=1 Tax=Clostridiisalibacter paucivorans TaxID=408753 RepID=UPI0012EB93F6|nr:hypothetical protein [Clostridiisalibacter paucivorans]